MWVMRPLGRGQGSANERAYVALTESSPLHNLKLRRQKRQELRRMEPVKLLLEVRNKAG